MESYKAHMKAVIANIALLRMKLDSCIVRVLNFLVVHCTKVTIKDKYEEKTLGFMESCANAYMPQILVVLDKILRMYSIKILNSTVIKNHYAILDLHI